MSEDKKLPLLKVNGIHVYYGAIHAIKGISLEVNEGEIVTLIGANGAGKSTTLNTIAGLLKPRQGSIAFAGMPVDGTAASKMVYKGLSLCPEGRRIFQHMTVKENLEMGAFSSPTFKLPPSEKKQQAENAGSPEKQQEEDSDIPEKKPAGILDRVSDFVLWVKKGFDGPKGELAASMERVYSFFPRLKEREKQIAGTLSGGEQQMLAMGRALMSKPRLMMLDEPSMGLAPILVEQIFAIIREMNQAGTTILLVEQNAQMALSVANRAYVMETGRITMEGNANDLMHDDNVRKAYLGS